MKKSIFTLVLILSVIGGIYFFYSNDEKKVSEEINTEEGIVNSKPNNNIKDDENKQPIPNNRSSEIRRIENDPYKYSNPKYALKLINSDSLENWHRGFLELLDYSIKREDAVNTARMFLNDKEPIKRVLASDILLRLNAYDQVADALASVIISNPDEIFNKDNNGAQRIALQLIKQYRVRNALDRIFPVLQQLEKSYKYNSLFVSMNYDPIVPVIKERAEQLGGQLGHLGVLKRIEEKDYIQSYFDNVKNKDALKDIAAWAMLNLGEKEPYLSYLNDRIKEVIDYTPEKGRSSSYHDRLKAFKYLTSIETPEVQKILEQSLKSQNSKVVDYALTNLILRYENKDKATEYILNALHDREEVVDRKLLYQLINILDDPIVFSAIEEKNKGYEQNNMEWSYLVHQKDWSIYNWIHNYTYNYTEG